MRGAKEGRGDGSKQHQHQQYHHQHHQQQQQHHHHQQQQQQKGAVLASEPAALFPRLHVNETEKAGPRAPPRNKMALYEQFTIPSNRYLPPVLPLPSSARASPASPYPQQYFSTECRYPYSPYYLQPPLAYATANIGSYSFGQPSMGVGSNSVVLDGDVEFQRVPGMQSTARSGVLSDAVRPAFTEHASISHKKLSGKESKDDDDFRVPIFSTEKPAVRMLHKKFAQIRGNSSSNVARSSEGVHHSSTVDSRQEASGHCRTRVEPQDSGPGLCGNTSSVDMQRRGKVSEDGTCDLQVEQLYSQSGIKPVDENESIVLQRQSSRHSEESKQSYERSITHQLNREASASVFDARTMSQCPGIGECVTANRDELESVERLDKSMNSVNNLELSTAAGVYPLKDDRVSERPPTSVDQIMGDKLECNLRRSLIGTSFDSTGESESASHGTGDISEPSEPGERSGSDDSDSSMLDLVSAPIIMPKDVMQVVGQQHFWKARRAIVRQQRIFSDQVFELHKLIQVQQMLAGTPGLTPAGNMYCNSTAATSRCDIDVPINAAEKSNRNSVGREVQKYRVSATKEASGYTLGQGTHPMNGCYPNWFGGTPMLNYDPYSHMYLSPSPSMPAVMPSGISVWGFPHPSLGFNQWSGPVAAPPAPYVNQPFPGVFPPGAAFADNYGYIMAPGIPTPGTPASVPPGCDHRPELPHGLYPRYGPVATGQQWQSSMSYDPCPAPAAVPEFSAELHSKPGHPVHPMQERPVSPSTLVVPISNQPGRTEQTSRVQFAPTAGAPVQSQWLSRITGQSGSKSFKKSISQDEHINLAAGSGAYTNNVLSPSPVADEHIPGHQAEQRWATGRSYDGNYHTEEVSHAYNVSDSADRVSKRHKKTFREVEGSRVPDEREVDEQDLTDHFQNALPLFPLAPGTNLSYREKCAGQAVEQGRVIRVVPHAAVAASKSAAGILLSIQQERQH